MYKHGTPHMYLGAEVREEAEDDGARVERVRHDEGGVG